MARSQSGESVLLRVVRILEAFGPGAQALSVTTIARRAGLPLATTSRLVGEMVGHGLLSREPGGVRVGVRLWELTQRASPTLALREVAMPQAARLTSPPIRALVLQTAVGGPCL